MQRVLRPMTINSYRGLFMLVVSYQLALLTISENSWEDIPDYVSIWTKNIKEESYNMTNLNSDYINDFEKEIMKSPIKNNDYEY